MINEAQKEFFVYNNEGKVAIQTLELSHPNLSKTYRLCNFYRDLELTTEDKETYTFTAANAQISIPSFSSKLDSTLNFQLDVINMDIIEEIDNIFLNPTDEYLSVVYRLYTDLDSEYPFIGPLRFESKDFYIEKNKLFVNANIHDLINNKVPYEIFTKEVFNGLKYFK
jgi:hypothetical protein